MTLDLRKSNSRTSLLQLDDCGSSTDEEGLTEDDVGIDSASKISSRSVSKNRSKSPPRRTRYSVLLWILRWPVFVSLDAFILKFLVLGFIVLDLVFYSFVRQIVAFIEYIFMTGKKRKLILEMDSAQTFSAWKKAAIELDKYLNMVKHN